MFLLSGIIAVAGAGFGLFAFSAQATQRAVDFSVLCQDPWTGSLQWTLNGADIGPPVDLSCPNISGKLNFRLNIILPVKDGAYADDFHITTQSDAMTPNTNLP